jgi:hypothetical protein
MTVISLVFGLVGGALTGLLIKTPCAEPMTDSFYEDEGEVEAGDE